MTDAKEDEPISVDDARALLLRVMRDDSEESYRAGWVFDNEFRLWSQVVRDPVVAGELREALLCSPLRDLAVVAGGWWAWPEASNQHEPVFVAMSEWLPIYAAHREKVIERYGPEGLGGLRAVAGEGSDDWLRTLIADLASHETAPQAKAMTRETAIGHLLRLMTEEAEAQWSTSWGPDHEHILWAVLTGDDLGSARGWASEPALLKELAAAANGWFAWSDAAKDVEFVPMERWLVMYRQYVEARRSKPSGGGRST